MSAKVQTVHFSERIDQKSEEENFFETFSFLKKVKQFQHF